MSDLDTSVLDNVTTLQIFLHLRLGFESDWGIRETQRALNITSTSTVSWHLDKLRDAGLVDKNKQNRYYITKEGQEINTVDLRLPQELIIFNGKVLSSKLILVGFTFSSILMAFIVNFIFPNLTVWYTLLTLLIIGSLLTREYLIIKKNVDEIIA